MAGVGAADIPVLVGMLGDERFVLRGLADHVLTEPGADGLATLKRAAEPRNPDVRRASQPVLTDYEISRANARPQE